MTMKGRIWLKKYKRQVSRWIINFCLLMTAFGGFLRDGFGADAAAQHVMARININRWPYNGRFLAYWMNDLLDRAGVNAVFHYRVFYLIFMVNCTLSLCILQEMLERVFWFERKERVGASGALSVREIQQGKVQEESEWSRKWVIRQLLLYTLSGLFYINGLFTENFMFPECFLSFSLAYLLCSLAAYLLAVRERNIVGFFLLLAASMLYQAPVAAVPIFIIAYRIMQERGEITKKTLRLSIIWVIAALFLAGGTTTVGGMMAAAKGELVKGVNPTGFGQVIASTGRNLLSFGVSGFHLMPPFCFPLLAWLLTIAILFDRWRKGKVKGKVFVLLLLSEAAFVLLAFTLSIAVYRPNRYAEVTPRLMYGMYAAQTLFMLMTAMFAGERGRRYLAYFSLLYLCVQIAACNTIMMNHYISNEEDLQVAREAYAQIQYYEQKTGKEIKHIAWCTDTNCENKYPNVYYQYGQINERVLSQTAYCMLVMATDNQRFTDEALVPMKAEIYDQYFKGKNWDVFLPQEQMIFQGDTLYWCIY